MSAPGDISELVIYANRYKQLKKLGQGSYGTVYLVHDLKSSIDKKVLKSIFIGDLSPNESSDAEHEAAILARIRHPNILRFYDSFIAEEYFCIVTEYCEDGDLDQFLKTLRRQRNRLQVDQVIDLFIQLLSAVEFLHSKRILHRDIKTSNIFLKRNQLRLGDFGISRLMMHTLDKASTYIGTPFYMSPETLRYDGYNMKSDIWSLGCVLYELSVCKRAFERPNLIQTIQAILHDSPPVLPERFPEKVRSLYLQMMCRDPEQRFNAGTLLDEFRKVEMKVNNPPQLSKQTSNPDGITKSSHADLQRSFSNSPSQNKNEIRPVDILADSSESVEISEKEDFPVPSVQCDPFSSITKQKIIESNRRKAQELIGQENFTRVYNYLQEQRRDQARDSTRTDDVILSGLETLSNNSQACTLINALVLYECLNELNEQK